jgi:hypothetical protein
MSTKLEAAPVLGVCSCLTAHPTLRGETERQLAGAFGEIALQSPVYAFDTSDYYRDEMGEGLERHWYCFRPLWRPERLARHRLATGRIEAALAEAGRRRVNLDPGYLDLGKLVLASRKEAPDKIYLGEGIWAHTCLRFVSGAFTAPEHSFPDFRDGRFNDFMVEARALYKSLLPHHQDQRAGA